MQPTISSLSSSSSAAAAAMAIPDSVFITSRFPAASIDTTASLNVLIYLSDVGVRIKTLYLTPPFWEAVLLRLSSLISLETVACVTEKPFSFKSFTSSSCVSMSYCSISLNIASCLAIFIFCPSLAHFHAQNIQKTALVKFYKLYVSFRFFYFDPVSGMNH